MKRVFKILRKQLVPLFLMILTFCLLKFVLLFGFVPTESMEPTLKKGSYMVGIRIYSKLSIGDVIIFRHDRRLLIKRIAAISAEQIEEKGKNLTVPEGCYYVLGDNADHSNDSRYWEEPFVCEEDIVAKLLYP